MASKAVLPSPTLPRWGVLVPCRAVGTLHKMADPTDGNDWDHEENSDKAHPLLDDKSSRCATLPAMDSSGRAL